VISKREWHADAAACPKGKLPSMIQESNLEGVGDIEVMSIISLIAPSTNARVGGTCLAMIEPGSRCSSQKRQVRILVCISCDFLWLVSCDAARMTRRFMNSIYRQDTTRGIRRIACPASEFFLVRVRLQ
jgi:hypothetical protein